MSLFAFMLYTLIRNLHVEFNKDYNFIYIPIAWRYTWYVVLFWQRASNGGKKNRNALIHLVIIFIWITQVLPFRLKQWKPVTKVTIHSTTSWRSWYLCGSCLSKKSICGVVDLEVAHSSATFLSVLRFSHDTRPAGPEYMYLPKFGMSLCCGVDCLK